MRLALTSHALTPEQLRVLADAMERLGIERVDIVPQITESCGRWFRLDDDALVSGRVVFEPDQTESPGRGEE